MTNISKKNTSDSFIQCLEDNGFDFRKSTKKEKQEDIDLVIWKVNESDNAFAVSIKKTIIKKSKKRRHVWAWVEMKDKHGEEGWLYKKSTFVIYERKKDFVLLQKSDFRNWIQSNNLARWDLPFVKDSWSASNRLFRRSGTREAIFHLKLSEAIKNCRHHIWVKRTVDE